MWPDQHRPNGAPMPLTTSLADNGRYDVVIDAPPVNAYSIGLLEDLIAVLGSVPAEATVVVLSAVGRGFCGGGDVKEVQQLPGFEGILGQSQFGLAACVAVEQC